MPEIIIIVVTLTTILLVFLFSLIFLRNSKRKNNTTEIDLTDFEDRVMELVSKFQHISATRLSSLENKINEMNKIMREANDTYFKLSSLLSDATKIMTELDKNQQITTVKQLNNINKDNADTINMIEKTDEEIKIDYTENYVPKTKKMTMPYVKNENSFTDSLSEELSNIEVDSIEVKSVKKIDLEEIEKPFDLKTSSLEHKILNLSSEGLDSASIAKKLGVGKGEVELVLGLFKRKFS